jgi:energy-coupling factor transport system substrate-specific component
MRGGKDNHRFYEQAIEKLSAADSTGPRGVSRRLIAFSARDLLNVALFAVVYCAVLFAISLLGTVSGFVLLATFPLSAGVAAVPFMLFLGRVQHVGMVTLFGAVVAVFFLVVGHPWQSAVLTIGVSLLAEVFLSAGHYRSKWAAMGAYIVFSVSFIGTWIPFFVDPVAYLLGVDPLGEDDLGQAVEIPSVGTLVGTSLIFGFWGALFGARLLGQRYRKVDPD